MNFTNYISSQYPGYYPSYLTQGHIYTLYNINYRLGYRFNKGHFIYEPQFQLGINDCDDFDTHFILKEEDYLVWNISLDYDTIAKEETDKLMWNIEQKLSGKNPI